MFAKFGGEQAPLDDYEHAYLRVVIAERMGWTLDYVDTLSQQDISDLFAVWGALARAKGKG